MSYYRSRPTMIEARQWDGTVESATTIIDWALSYGGTIRYHDEDNTLVVDTAVGTMLARPGDWIVRGLEDNLFDPFGPKAFEATYEPAPIEESVP